MPNIPTRFAPGPAKRPAMLAMAASAPPTPPEPLPEPVVSPGILGFDDDEKIAAEKLPPPSPRRRVVITPAAVDGGGGAETPLSAREPGTNPFLKKVSLTGWEIPADVVARSLGIR